eukprot:GABW01002133.1.p3 GENE.GABW01002133.1~~GABW01002133.1.p3  ORF type:complete len:54 (-),score=7.94 GABW01002133.1:3-164(-)
MKLLNAEKGYTVEARKQMKEYKEKYEATCKNLNEVEARYRASVNRYEMCAHST